MIEWQTSFLEALQALDVAEAPHGLYGMRQAHAAGGRLPTFAHLLSSPASTGHFRSRGIHLHRSRLASGELSLRPASREKVVLEVLDFATTKVRRFGSAFRLDEHNAKEARSPQWELESLLPKLARRRWLDIVPGILLLCHFQPEKELATFLGRSTQAAFCGRYELTHTSRQWEDQQGRGFSTAVHLWLSNSPVTPCGT